jgi:hypothetical protein
MGLLSIAKKSKPGHPSGLLPQFKTEIHASKLWDKTNLKPPQTSGHSRQVTTILAAAQQADPDERFSDLYGGFIDKDDSKEAAVQLSSMKASKAIVRFYPT